MLADKDVVATIAVTDMHVAAEFYEGTLGLSRAEGGMPDPDTILYRSGQTGVLVYRSEYAGTNKATTASWAVGDDFDAIIAELGAKGVSFEHYELPGTTREGDVHLMGELKAAWFKDPDGNILNLVNQSQ